MTESKHTPWRVEKGTANNVFAPQSIYIREASSGRFAYICQVFGVLDRELSEANAALIAAAPDLLAACEHIDKWFRSMLEYIPDYEWEQIEPVVAAIAKARSE